MLANRFCLNALTFILLEKLCHGLHLRANLQVLQPVIRQLPEDFVSFGLDASLVRKKWCSIDWRKAIILARPLAPAILRFGGTEADRIVFTPERIDYSTNFYADSNECSSFRPAITSVAMSSKDFDKLVWFAQNSHWNLSMDLNVLLRDSKGNWNSTNAKRLLKYAQKRNYTLGFELGNEPNSFRHVFGMEVPAKQLAADYAALKKILSSFEMHRDSFVIGPSVTQPDKKRTIKYLKSFLKYQGAQNVNAVTFHQYYVNGRTATISQFLDPNILDALIPEIHTAKQLTERYTRKPGFPVWLGETASAFGGGAPNLSDTYAAGFMWLDKLGVSAREGLSCVVRQSFYHGHYALLDDSSDPNPDYWLTLLYKRIVGQGVRRMNVSLKDQGENRNLRFYAHSNASGITIYGMNLGEVDALLTFGSYRGVVEEYLLEPGENSLTSRKVLLNGRVLDFDGRKVYDNFKPRRAKQPLVLPAQRFAFYVIPRCHY